MPVATSWRLLALSLSVLVILAGMAGTPVSAASADRGTAASPVPAGGSAASEPAAGERTSGAHRTKAERRADRKADRKAERKADRKNAGKGKKGRGGKGGGKGKGGGEPVVETPTEPVVETPAEPVVETSAEPVVETPAEPVAEPVAETPADPVVETPAEPVAETPAEPVAETPVDPVVDDVVDEELEPVAELLGTYYVDPITGSDSHSGTTPVTAWRTLTRASEATLEPGQTLLLSSGADHVGALHVTESGTSTAPITVGAYGTGEAPVVSEGTCVRLAGAWITVTGVHAADCRRAGFHVEGTDITVTGVEASGSVAGVWVRPGAQRATVSHSHIHDNIHMAPGTDGPDDDYGAFGIEVNGDHTRVIGNTISGHEALSPDYGKDGAAVEVYQAVGTLIEGNTSSQDLAFTELGGSRTAGTRVVGNTVSSAVVGAAFLMTRGPGQVWGPVTDTVAERNTVALTGEDSFGFGCYGGCTASHLVMKDNTISAGWYVGWVDGTFTSTGNTYSGELWFPLGPGDRHL